MFVVRFLLLSFLVLCGWGAAISPIYEASTLVTIFAYSFLLTLPALYMLPTYEAWRNKHPNIVPIALVNFFLGWSLIGWVISIAWAFKINKNEIPHTQLTQSNESNIAKSQMKSCPFCAEDILSAAIKCKHCNSELSTQSGG